MGGVSDKRSRLCRVVSKEHDNGHSYVGCRKLSESGNRKLLVQTGPNIQTLGRVAAVA